LCEIKRRKRERSNSHEDTKKESKMDAELEGIARDAVDSAYLIYRELGPALLETVYEVLLARELERRGHRVRRQVPVPIVFQGLRFDEGFRADLPRFSRKASSV
jgi:PD-(D/E)XK nuclease superfamily